MTASPEGRKDSEQHPEWWDEAFRDFDAMRALMEALQPGARSTYTPVKIDDALLPALRRALDEAISVDSSVLDTGIHDGIDQYWVRLQRAGIDNLEAFSRELAELEAVSA